MLHRNLNVHVISTDFNNEANNVKTITINNECSVVLTDKMIIKKKKDAVRRFIYPIQDGNSSTPKYCISN